MTNDPTDSNPWWVDRWLEILDSYRFKKRLERARIYAREGNVLSIHFDQSIVKAEVQGSDIEPYLVTMSLTCFSEEDWQGVIESLSQKALLRATLILGEMPKQIEQAFVNNGLNLFPYSLSDIISECSCPDKANPCKHIGALYYQLAERFAEDPFVMFQLRGKTKQQILEGIRLQNGQEIIDISPEAPTRREISNDPAIFWQQNTFSLADLTKHGENLVGKTIFDVLGRITLPQEEADSLTTYLKQVYQKCQQIAAGKINMASPKE